MIVNQCHASNLIDKETYPPKIQKRLGHASLKITMDTYGHFFDKHDKKMVDTLEMIQGGQKVENFKWTIDYCWEQWNCSKHLTPCFIEFMKILRL